MVSVKCVGGERNMTGPLVVTENVQKIMGMENRGTEGFEERKTCRGV